MNQLRETDVSSEETMLGYFKADLDMTPIGVRLSFQPSVRFKLHG